ncbi:MAG: LysM peptidoglycan-binding domain-containing protein, partial [Planctomycetota bacterium]
MRQDVKIGILVGGLVIVAAVIWFVATGGGPEENGEATTDDNEVTFNTGGQDDQPDNGGGRVDAGGSRGTVTPVVGGGRDSDSPFYTHDSGPGDLGVDDDDDSVTGRDPVTPVTGRGSLPDDDDDRIDISSDPIIDDDRIDISSDPIDDDRDDRDDDRVDRDDRDVPDSYRVVEGDQGFWGIAKKLYGAGRYYYLIAEANPDVDPTRLRAGQVLRIPPLPREVSSADTEADALAGAPRGSTTYTVEAGDAGFWGIAKKEYGAGKYYYLIAEANPDANPARLQ